MTSPLYWAVLLSIGAAGIVGAGVLGQPPNSPWLYASLVACAAIQAAAGLIVLARPTRTPLAAAVGLNLAGLFVWIVAHTTGLRLGTTVWRPETLGLPDFYLPAMQLVAGLLLVLLCARSSTDARRARFAPLAIVLLATALLVVSYVRTPGATVVALVNFVMIAGLPTSPLVALAIEVALAIGLTRMAVPKLRRNVLASLPALLVSIPLTWAAAGTAYTRPWLPASPAPVTAPPAGATATVAYCSPGGDPLAMDLTMPAATDGRPAPVLVYVHGGAGFLGSRTYAADQEGAYFTQLRDRLTARGFVVGSIDYGFIPLHTLTEVVQDTGCAIRFLRAHADELGIDATRVGVYGDSEGGYVAAMLGTAGPKPDADGLDVGEYLEQSSRVQAVVDMWGFSDLTDFSGSPSWIASISQASHSNSLPAQRLSPLYRVQPGDPPFLIIHGLDDWFIAPHHSTKLAETLSAHGVPATLVLVEHDAHGLAAVTSGGVEAPTPDELVHTVCDFFVSTLGAV